MKKLIICGIVLAVCGQVFCADVVVVHEAKGRGPTRDQAIRSALYQAIGQVRGVEVGSGDFSLDFAAAGFRHPRGSKGIGFEAASVHTSGTVNKAEIGGLVGDYEVIDEQKIDEDTYEVTLKVSVLEYEPPDKTGRVRVAIMPVNMTQENYAFGELEISAGQISLSVLQALSSALTKTNKVAVLDRDYIAEFARERNILVSEDAPIAEKARLGRVLGADYLLVGTLSRAEVRIRNLNSRVVGRTMKEYEADVVFDYRLIVSSTRAAKLSDSVKISLRTDQVKKLVERWEPSNLDWRELADNLIARMGRMAVDRVMGELYPVRIASINEDGRVVIDQGAGRIVKGQLLNVYVKGREIMDMDTSESLGNMEILIATIQVDQVSSRFSYANVIQGDASKLSKGQICRVKKAAVRGVPGRRSTIEKTGGGGVSLPFD